MMRRLLSSSRLWLRPLLLTAILASLFAAVYFFSTKDPQAALRGLPIAIVVEPQQAAPGPAARNAEAFVNGIGSAVDRLKVDLHRMDRAELDRWMSQNRLAGAVVIPADFDARIAALLAGSPSDPVVPATVSLQKDAADGGDSGALVDANLQPALAAATAELGRALLADSGSGSVGGAQRYLLAHPVTIRSTDYRALPANSGLGSTAFYLSLVLVLIGVMGATTIAPTVAAVTRARSSGGGGRLRILLLEYAVMAGIAPVVALVLVLVAGLVVRVPTPDPVMLWGFGTASIMAVGFGALAALSVLGTAFGALFNALFFIALSMSASGSIVPVEATPAFFHVFTELGPFHAVIEGVRAIVFFDSDPQAGLTSGWLRVIVLAAVGIGVGVGWCMLPRRRGRPAGTGITGPDAPIRRPESAQPVP